MNKTATIAALLLVLSGPFGLAEGADFAPLCADRAAMERVYHAHRTGTKRPFEEAMPRALLERLVREEAQKEAVLARTYGVKITAAMVATEVERINTTTRAPEILAEIKAALGGDAEKFANAFAKPILVERELRQRFENDDALHAAVRRESEQARNELLAAKTNGASAGQLLAQFPRARSNAVSEAIWQLGARPEEKSAAPTADELEIKQRFGADAQIISSPQAGRDKVRKIYFEDLPVELQNVLRVQLRQAGDVSAVIETPGGFLLYLAREKTAETLAVSVLSLPKRNYEQWLAEQASGTEK